MESMLTDPSMKEVVDDFCQESSKLLTELDDYLDLYEEDPENAEALEKFGQIIDRIMGAAKSVGAEKTGIMCELGKTIGYKTSQVETDAAMKEIITAVLFDNVDLLKKIIKQISQGSGENLKGLSIDAFVSRLRWLSEKFAHIERSSVAIDPDSKKKIDQASIDDLLKNLGL